MINLSRKPVYVSLFLTLISGLYFVQYWLVNQPQFLGNSLLTFAVTFDLILIPLALYYFVMVRKVGVVKVSLAGVLILSIIAANFLLPEGSKTYLSYVEIFAGIVELSVIALLVVNIRKVRKEYLSVSENSSDFVRNLRQSFSVVISSPLLLNVITSEAAMFRYGLFFFEGKQEIDKESLVFTTWERSGFGSMMGVFLAVSIIETIALHLLLQSWSVVAAWVLTGISIYTAIFIVAYWSSVLKRPILFKNDVLHLRIGILWNAEIRKDTISSVSRIRNFEKDSSTLNIGTSVFEEPNVLIELNKETSIDGLYGFKKQINRVALYVDKPDALLKFLS
ncbi:MAG: hypothetical protein ACI9V1_003709 [Spirosomataceae bacterium]|jgi:hypothetical protein